MDIGSKDRQHGSTTEMLFATVGRKLMRPKFDGGLSSSKFDELEFEFKLANTVKDNKTGFLKYVNSKRRRIGDDDDNVGLLLDEASHLTNKDIDKAEMFNAFFTSVFNMNDGAWDPQSSVLEDCD